MILAGHAYSKFKINEFAILKNKLVSSTNQMKIIYPIRFFHTVILLMMALTTYYLLIKSLRIWETLNFVFSLAHC